MSEFVLWPHIVDVLRHYGVTASLVGPVWAPFRCTLPTHPGEDRRPSASYCATLNRWTCHTCALSGTGNSYVRLMEGLADAQAAEAWWEATTNEPRPESPSGGRDVRGPRTASRDHSALFADW